MFTVPGWSVPAGALKTQAGDVKNRAAEGEVIEASQASTARKRKRKSNGAQEDAANVQPEDLTTLWRTHVEKIPLADAVSDRTTKKKSIRNIQNAGNKHSGLPVGSTDSQTRASTHKKESRSRDAARGGEGTSKKISSAQKASLPTTHDTAVEAKQGVNGNPELDKPLLRGQPTANPKITSLQSNMRQKLISSRFRYLNESLYTKPSINSLELFKENPQFFHEYHEGFRRQAESWPENPLQVFLGWIRHRGMTHGADRQRNNYKRPRHMKDTSDGTRNLNESHKVPIEPLPRNFRSGICTIADLGCGEGQLAASLLEPPPKPPLAKRMRLAVHSFDLASTSTHVTACDIRSLPLGDGSVDVAIFCLALMGTNWIEFIEEAYRILRWKGECWISEVGSRFAGYQEHAPTDVNGTSRRKAKAMAKKPQRGELRNEELPITVDEVSATPQPSTNVSAFLDVLRRRGFQLVGDPEMDNKMFVRMRFLKALPPSKGKGVLFSHGSDRPAGRPAFIEDNSPQGVSDDVEAAVLKPCVYKLR